MLPHNIDKALPGKDYAYVGYVWAEINRLGERFYPCTSFEVVDTRR